MSVSVFGMLAPSTQTWPPRAAALAACPLGAGVVATVMQPARRRRLPE